MSLVVNLSESEARILLESLIARERQVIEVCETSDDEDLVANPLEPTARAWNFLTALRFSADCLADETPKTDRSHVLLTARWLP